MATYLHCWLQTNTGATHWANLASLASLDRIPICTQSAVSITRAIKRYAPDISELFICGGGIHNCELIRRLKNKSFATASTQSIGLDPDWVEASAFAWLAMRAIKGKFGNLPSVTGASKYAVLGDIYIP